MRVGYVATFQNPGREYSDAEVYQQELKLAKMAEPLGFNSVWTVEHHFSGYQMIPDPLVFLSHMSGACPSLELGTMCVVLPWHNPVRVVEQAIMLDHYSQGKLILGLARGAGTTEFDGFGVDMGKSRQTFIEACQMLTTALETGVAEYDGEIVKQPRVVLRPEPFKSFKGRIYVGSVSPESFDMMAKLGVGVLITPAKPWDVVANDLRTYRLRYQEYHNAQPAPTIGVGWVFCDESEERAREMAHKYIKGYWKTVLDHYGFNRPQQFKGRKGYEYYEKNAQQGLDDDAIAEDFLTYHIWGTPEQCYDKIMNVRDHIGCAGFNTVFRYAGMPYDEAERNLRLFSRTVLPELVKLPDPAPLAVA